MDLVAFLRLRRWKRAFGVSLAPRAYFARVLQGACLQLLRQQYRITPGLHHRTFASRGVEGTTRTGPAAVAADPRLPFPFPSPPLPCLRSLAPELAAAPRGHSLQTFTDGAPVASAATPEPAGEWSVHSLHLCPPASTGVGTTGTPFDPTWQHPSLLLLPLLPLVPHTTPTSPHHQLDQQQRQHPSPSAALSLQALLLNAALAAQVLPRSRQPPPYWSGDGTEALSVAIPSAAVLAGSPPLQPPKPPPPPATPAARPTLPAAAVSAGVATPGPQPGLPTGVSLRRLATAGGSRAAAEELHRQLIKSSGSLRELQDAVERLRGRLLPEHHVAAAQALAALWTGPELSGGHAASDRGQQKRMRDLAESCSLAALSSRGAGLDIALMRQLLEAWQPMGRPPRGVLALLADALVPEAHSFVPEIYEHSRDLKGGRLTQQQQCVDHLAAKHARKPVHAPVRVYGLLHAATLADVAALLPLLKAASLANLKPIRDVVANIAVRRAGNEDLSVLVAAANAFRSAGTTDPRVAESLLDAALAPAPRRGSRRGGGGPAASDVAALLSLCSKARYHDPASYGMAAEVLLAEGVGSLDLQQVMAVVRAFAEAHHPHPMLLAALATRTKELLAGSRTAASASTTGGGVAGAAPVPASSSGSRSEGAAHSHQASAAPYMLPGLLATAGDDGDGGGGSRGSSGGTRALNVALNSVGALVRGFGLMQLEDSDLYGDLLACAVQCFRATEETLQRRGLGAVNPRVLGAALVGLAEGLAAAGMECPAELVGELQRWAPRVVVFMKVSELTALATSLERLRLRDGRILSVLDAEVAARLLPEEAPPPPPPIGGMPGRGDNTTRRGGGGASGDRGKDPAAAGVDPRELLTWLPQFLEAMCGGLAYPCENTLSVLGALRPAAGAEDRAGSGRYEDRGREEGSGVQYGAGGSGRWRTAASPSLSLLGRMLKAAAPVPVESGAAPGEGGGSDPAAPLVPPSEQICRLMGALACAGALAHEDTVRQLSRALARTLLDDNGFPPSPPTGPSAARSGQSRTAERRTAAAVAALSDAAAAQFFRAVVATSGDAGLAAALQDELPPPLAAPLLVRAADAWHSAGLGTAVPLTVELPTAAATAAASPPPLLRRLQRRRGGAAAPPRLVPELLQTTLQLPVFGACDTPDGFFRVECGVGLMDGVMVGVEVLPDRAFALVTDTDAPLSQHAQRSSAAPSPQRRAPQSRQQQMQQQLKRRLPEQGHSWVQYALVGDAAFRARCLRERGWQLVALRASEWAEAETQGREACLSLLSRALSEVCSDWRDGSS